MGNDRLKYIVVSPRIGQAVGPTLDGNQVQAFVKELGMGLASSPSSRDPSTPTGTPVAERPARPEENQGSLTKPPREMGVLLIALGISETTQDASRVQEVLRSLRG